MDISGNRLGSTAATSPPAISRFEASPEAETPSYVEPPPWRISVTISSEVSAYFTLTLQPVSFSKSVTQSKFGSLVPSST